jgi:hypothetical protein
LAGGRQAGELDALRPARLPHTVALMTFVVGALLVPETNRDCIWDEVA